MLNPYRQDVMAASSHETSIVETEVTANLADCMPMLIDLRDTASVVRGPDPLRPVQAVSASEEADIPMVTIRSEQHAGRLDGYNFGVWSVVRTGLPRVQVEMQPDMGNRRMFSMFEVDENTEGKEGLRVASPEVQEDTAKILLYAAEKHREMQDEKPLPRHGLGRRLLNRLGLGRPQ